MSVQSSLVMYPIFDFGSDAQREKFLPKLGESNFCYDICTVQIYIDLLKYSSQ